MPASAPHVLYYAPMVCSLVPHAVLRELALPFELVRVDLRSHTTTAGDALSSITPKDYVPALRLPDGSVLTETSVILLYLADLVPARGLAPAPSDPARLRFLELLAFVATEFHKGFAPFTIMQGASDASKQWMAARLARRVEILDAQLADQPYFTGAALSVADFYAHWALGTYARLTKGVLPARLVAFTERMAARPSVRDATQLERAG